MLLDNARRGRPIAAMADVVRAWLALMATDSRPRDPQAAWFTRWASAGAETEAALNTETLFPDGFRSDARLRAAILQT